MFTGIVEDVGTVEAISPLGPSEGGRCIRVRSERLAARLEVGGSVAVNGCCLTATEVGAGHWSADAVPETLARTNLGALSVGDLVNLELPLRAQDVLGGHLVQGHVDATGAVLRVAPDLKVSLPSGLDRYIVEKGSITVDGVSLTVVEAGDDFFAVAVIPHTMEATILGRRKVGDAVNLEVDVIAKYVERLLGAGTSTPYAPAHNAGGQRSDRDGGAAE
ncbi:MAG: riboflavin synthase [Acidimicrobiales bacterium]